MKQNISHKSLLPLNNPSEDLETISRNKLSLLFSPSLFEVRPELQRDKGVDLIIELKQDNAYTNFRFVVQVKSSVSTKENKDGSVSYPTDVSNINYLLNYGMPSYYILHDHETDIFYFEQAYKVFQSLLKKYKSAKFSKKFNIRFFNRLDSNSIKEIYQKTFENGVLLRRLNEQISVLATTKERREGIVIDHENEVYSVEQNIKFIEELGILLLNRGEYKRIVEIEQRTHPRTATPPMFNLVCGVAYYQQANLFRAIEFLKEAQNHASSFNPSIRSTLTYTFIQARYLLGLIKEDEFKSELSKLMQAEQLGSYLEVEGAYTAFLESRKNGAEIKVLQNKISALISKEPDNVNLRIRAYSIILHIEQVQLQHNLALNFVLLCGRVSDLSTTKTFKKWEEIDQIHSERLKLLLKFCINTNNFLAFSNVMKDAAEWGYEKIYTLFALKNWNRKAFKVIGILSTQELEMLDREAKRIDAVIEGYEMLEHRENIVYALRLKYELMDFADRKEEAKTIAEQIMVLIGKYDMNALKLTYQAMINEDSRYNRFITGFTAHLLNIYRAAKNSGIGKFFIQPIPAKLLRDIESSEKEIKWMNGDFFELNFPDVPQVLLEH